MKALRIVCRFALAVAGLSSSPLAQDDVLYLSDFEADDGGLAGSGNWEYGSPTSGPGGAHSGERCWGTNLSGASNHETNNDLVTPAIDASVAENADGLVVSWWQYIDDVGGFEVDVAAFSGGTPWQHVFGLIRSVGSTSLPHTGWRQFRVLLGADFATDELTLRFRYRGDHGDGDGLYVDDLSVSVLRATTVELEDFEAGTGGFVGDGAWGHGAVTDCPGPVSAASGLKCWANSLICTYPLLADDALVSRDIDLTPYANRHEVYLYWSRFADFESPHDGLHHELSFDGGTTWEYGAGVHGIAHSGNNEWTKFGLALDPSGHPQVRLRLRVTSDSEQSHMGAWLDDFEIAVPEVIAGSGANPADSLSVSAGAFGVGEVVTLDVDDPSGAFAASAVGVFLFATQPAPNLPDGTPVPGWAISGSGDAGDLLVDLGSVVSVLAGTAWSAGQASQLTVPLPANPALVGTELWLQGALIDASSPLLRVGLTNGLYERL